MNGPGEEQQPPLRQKRKHRHRQQPRRKGMESVTEEMLREKNAWTRRQRHQRLQQQQQSQAQQERRQPQRKPQSSLLYESVWLEEAHLPPAMILFPFLPLTPARFGWIAMQAPMWLQQRWHPEKRELLQCACACETKQPLVQQDWMLWKREVETLEPMESPPRAEQQLMQLPLAALRPPP